MTNQPTARAEALRRAHHENQRRDLWLHVAAATAGSSNCVKETSAARFADQALEAFDKRFTVDDLPLLEDPPVPAPAPPQTFSTEYYLRELVEQIRLIEKERDELAQEQTAALRAQVLDQAEELERARDLLDQVAGFLPFMQASDGCDPTWPTSWLERYHGTYDRPAEEGGAA